VREWYDDKDSRSVELQLQLLELLSSLSVVIEKAQEIALLLDKDKGRRDLE
jgi:hypothetical protein